LGFSLAISGILLMASSNLAKEANMFLVIGLVVLEFSLLLSGYFY